MRTTRVWMIVGLTGALAQTAWAQGTPAAAPPAEAKPAEAHVAMSPKDIKWGDAPPIFVKGAKMAVLYGDPSKEGLFIVRLKMPPNYKIAPHTHPTAESVTVISGAFAIGMGDAIDAKTKALPAGSFYSMPAGMHHYAFSKGATEVEVSAMGPFVLNYINPADDPSKTAAAAPK